MFVRIFLVLVGLSGSCVAGAQVFISEQDRNALETFYEVTKGDDWLDNSGWLGEPGSECDWHGVICGLVDDYEATATPIIGLSLPGNSLQGDLGAALNEFKNLQVIALRDNDLYGGLPEWIGRFSSLHILDLGNNPLGGEIPQSLFENETVFKVWLDGAGLSGSIPETVYPQGHQLTTMMLHDNQLVGEIPPWVGALPNLKQLALDNNQLEGNVPEFVQAHGSGLGVEITLSGNRLGGLLPDSLAQHPGLFALDLSGNEFAFNVHEWLESQASPVFPVIRALNLSDNEFQGGYPERLADTSRLYNLDLSSNRFSGTVPDSLLTPNRTQALLDISDNPDLMGQLSDATEALIVVSGLTVEYSGTGVTPSDCGAIRIAEGYRAPNRARGWSRVWIYLGSARGHGSFTIVDSIPQGWSVEENPFCFCSDDDRSVRFPSPYMSESRGTRYRYDLEMPMPGSGFFESPFPGGELVFSDPDIAPMRICGDPMPFRDTVFVDRFGG